MAGANAKKQRPGGHPWRKRTLFSHRLFCCSCVRGGGEEEEEEKDKDPLREQEKEITGGPLRPRSDQRGSGEREAVQITADLGIVNGSFSLLDEDLLTPANGMARSSSSVSARGPGAPKKKQVKPLSSLPLQPRVQIYTSGGDDEEEEEEEEDDDDRLLFESGASSVPASAGLLTTPVINLIPPTPSDIVDDDLFFDVNSEESVAHTSGSSASFASNDQESNGEKIVNGEEEEELDEELTLDGDKVSVDSAAELDKFRSDQFGEEKEALLPNAVKDKERTKSSFFASAYQAVALLEYPQKNDLSNRDESLSKILNADLCLLPYSANMDTLSHQQRPITRSHSCGETLTRSATFHGSTQTTGGQDDEGLPRQRRVTIASYMHQSKDQNGNFPEKQYVETRISNKVMITWKGSVTQTMLKSSDMERQKPKSLKEMNIDEVCQWFTTIGLQKCLPFIRDAKLCGGDIASVGMNTLDLLHISTLEDREQLLAAIYNELHPPSAIVSLDSLPESLCRINDETETATIASMSKSKSSPHVSCLSMNRRSLKVRNNSQNYMVQRNSQLIEITINASQRIVHLRTPKETTVGKIMDSCIKMLGVTEDKSVFILKEKQDSLDELAPDRHIGSLLTSTSEKRQLELHLCKTEKSPGTASRESPQVNRSNENGNRNKNVHQGNQPGKEERIRELNQQVDSLQNVILQVQELHHGLVAFCSELKNMDGDVDVDRLSSAELKQRLELLQGRMNDKKQSLQTLRDNINNSAAYKNKQLDVRLLEKMKLNCQVFKEEISMVHLTRQVAHLQNTLQESRVKENVQKQSWAVGSLSQLVSPESPVMLLVVQENRGQDGRYSFTCHRREEGSGLPVVVGVAAHGSHLRVDDRLVEVNGVSVVNSTQEELADILLRGSSAQIVALRQPPQVYTGGPDPTHTTTPSQRDADATDTPPQRKVIAI